MKKVIIVTVMIFAFLCTIGAAETVGTKLHNTCKPYITVSGASNTLMKNLSVSSGMGTMRNSIVPFYYDDDDDGDRDVSASRKLTGARVMAGIGTGFFWATFGLYGLISLVAPVALGTELNARGDAWLPLAGIMLTGLLPFIGPFIAAGLCLYMANDFPAFSSTSRNNMFYGGLTAMCIIFGLVEIGTFILMITGKVLKAKYRRALNFKINPFIESEESYGLRVAYGFKV